LLDARRKACYNEFKKSGKRIKKIIKKYKVHVEDNGTIRWYNKKGKCHRLDGPAVELFNGDKFWFKKNLLHRLDGPAIEWEDGDKEWYINGNFLTEKEFNKRVNTCKGKIEGMKYKLTQV